MPTIDHKLFFCVWKQISDSRLSFSFLDVCTCTCTWMEGGGVKAMVMGHFYCDHSMIFLSA